MGDSKIIFELFPESFLRRRPPLVPVGRLDKWASGALICTQNGDLVHTLSSPKLKTGSYGKVYEVKLQKRLTGNEAKLFSSGDVKLKSDTKPCKPAIFEVINAEEKLVRITLYEGRYHQVRRMLGSLGNKVEQIKRIATGPIQLGDLPVGHWRLLTQAELDILNVVDLPKKSKKAEKYSRKK
jgi:16S rRNA pseudouridine516 synthase